MSESIEFFRVTNGAVAYFDSSPANTQPSAPKQAASSVVEPSDKPTRQATAAHSSSSAPVPAALAPSAIPLPVPQEDVSFSLSMSVEEQAAKSKVQLPYVHQGRQDATDASSFTGFDNGGAGNLFFIDEDDPDWDDDDLDDDLDI